MKIKKKSINAIPIEILCFIIFYPVAVYELLIIGTIFYYKDIYKWRKECFAFYPVISTNGNFIWLENYIRVCTQGMTGTVIENLSIDKTHGLIGYF